MNIEISGAGSPLTSSDIAALERRIGHLLQGDYRSFLLMANGGVPRRSVFVIPSDRRSMRDTVGVFLMIGDADSSLGLETCLDQLRGRIPDDFIPIANCGCGDTLLLGVGTTSMGQVAWWDHEEEGDSDVSNVHQVAPSFTAFVDSLEPMEELS